jgi:hypothetical protein
MHYLLTDKWSDDYKLLEIENCEALNIYTSEFHLSTHKDNFFSVKDHILENRIVKFFFMGHLKLKRLGPHLLSKKRNSILSLSEALQITFCGSNSLVR